MCKTNAYIRRTWSNRSFLMAFLEALGLKSAAPIITAGASLLGGISRNKEAKLASARQMAFQRDMSDTSYQRGMADMKKAGLNPILAGKMGGASTPTGSTYQPENVANNAVTQYLATQQNIANIDRTEAETQKIKAETKVTRDSSGSIPGKFIEYIAKNLMYAYKGISQSQIVDEIMKQNQEFFAYSGKNLNEAKKYVNGIVSNIFNSKQPGVRIKITPGGIKMPDGTIKRTK
ncbi:minor capsid protein [Marine gokushovirus]|nr:minor capsid protein [Marine gokushovirus]